MMLMDPHVCTTPTFTTEQLCARGLGYTMGHPVFTGAISDGCGSHKLFRYDNKRKICGIDRGMCGGE